MPYKKNKLRLKQERISKECSRRGKYGNEVKRRMMRENASEWTITSTIRTDGVIGEHVIEMLTSPDDPKQMLVRVNGEIRKPYTVNGFGKVLAEYLWKKG